MLMSKNAVVVNSTSTVADGTYGNGSTIDLLVEFSEPVAVTGIPNWNWRPAPRTLGPRTSPEAGRTFWRSGTR